MNIYLDNAATTQLDPRVFKVMLPYLQKNYTNASSIHFPGQKNNLALEQARAAVAKNLGTTPERLIFTSGASEANNFILRGVMAANQEKGRHLIVSAIEHPSVYQTAKDLALDGYQVDFLPVDHQGIVDLEILKKLLRPDTVLVSVMAVNNEIGTRQPLEKIAQLVRANQSYFHSDLVQAVVYDNLKIDKLGLDFASLSAHKFNGPTGVGLAVINPQVKIKALITGGEQENGWRAGTYNLAAIIGLAKALDIVISERQERVAYVKDLRDYFWQKIKNEITDVSLNGCKRRRTPNNLNVLFKRVEGEAVLIDLSTKGIQVSTGSACSAHNLKSSYVLHALGLRDEDLNSNIRFSLSVKNTKKEIDYVVKSLKIVVSRLRELTPIK